MSCLRSDPKRVAAQPLNIRQLSRKELCKAACCNLSEAFETNASVDAGSDGHGDSHAGARGQVRLLVDNLSGPRGLNVVQGWDSSWPWIQHLHFKRCGDGGVRLRKLTGQINVAHRNADTAEPFFEFVSRHGRENRVQPCQQSRGWSTMGDCSVSHGEFRQRENDRNRDRFSTCQQRRLRGSQ